MYKTRRIGKESKDKTRKKQIKKQKKETKKQTKKEPKNYEYYQLEKSKFSRLKDVKTYLYKCNKGELKGVKTIDKKDNIQKEALQVIKAFFENYKNPVILKVYKSNSPFLINETRIYKHLYKNKFQYMLKPICLFTCYDKYEKYKNPITDPIINPIIPCNINSDLENSNLENSDLKLSFLVFDYLPNGDISNFINVNNITKYKKQIIKSIVLQYILSIFELGLTYNVLHGDLNSGNILIKKTKQKENIFYIKNKKYNIPTYNFEPIIIDYGRANIVKNTYDYDIIFNILTTYLQIIKHYVKEKDRQFLYNYFNHINENDTFETFFQTNINLFDKLEIN